MSKGEIFSVIVAEDELPAIRLLEKFIHEHPQLSLVRIARNGIEAFDLLSSEAFDLLFLDINLPVLSGIEVLEKLDRIPYVIFSTAYNEYAVKAFEIGAIDYLLKPFTAERFNKAVARFLVAVKENTPYDIYRGIQEIKGPDKYKKSNLTEDNAEHYKKLLLEYMEESNAYRDMDISLQAIAEALDVSPHHLSQVINQNIGKNFYEFLNHYRVEEAKNELTRPEFRDKKIIDISYDVGFNSKSAFNAVFKKICHVTPSQYRKKYLK